MKKKEKAHKGKSAAIVKGENKASEKKPMKAGKAIPKVC